MGVREAARPLVVDDFASSPHDAEEMARIDNADRRAMLIAEYFRMFEERPQLVVRSCG